MSFIQGISPDDCEQRLQKIKAAFVSDDLRIYEEIEFWDDTSVWHIPAKTILALYELQTQIEMMKDGRHELAFDDVVRDAQDLKESFDKAVAAIGYKPIHKRGRK